MVADGRPDRSLAAFHRKPILGANQGRRYLLPASAGAIVQSDVAFFRYIENAVLKTLGYLGDEDGSEPIDPGHHAALFEMLFPSII